MPNRNLPFTRFRSYEGRTPVPRVERAHLEGDHGPDLPPTLAEGRILRVRRLARAEADAEAARWAAAGARRLEGPVGWTILERTRPDAVTGLPRRQRLAMGPGPQPTALNLSVLEPADREDEALWARTLDRLAAHPPARADLHDGAGEAHDWAA